MPRTALVTGATAGFGAAIARRLLDAGYTVAGTGRRAARLDAQAADWGPAFVPLCFDLRDAAAAAAAWARLPPAFDRLDVLVNNAGLALGIGPADAARLDDWHTMIDTNVRALVTTTHQLLPRLLAAGGGHIVNIGSVAGRHAYPGGNVYGATKAFVDQFSANLRADLLPHGTRVTTIAPGLAETEFSLVRFGGDATRAAAVYAGTDPLLAQDIAEAVDWALRQPPRVNINHIEIMAGCQAMAGFQIRRRGL